MLLVSSSRHPDKWIVPGGGMEPEEEPNVAAAREVCEEVGSLITYHVVYSMLSVRFSSILSLSVTNVVSCQLFECRLCTGKP